MSGRTRRGASARSGHPTGATPAKRCAVYVRQSNDESARQDFGSLQAQREAAEAYIASQAGEGWIVLPERYDDGGFSGGNMDRPALQRLLRHVEEEMIDCVVVYKVDRLSRSLLDFTRIIETFDRLGVSFVSVTQAFNTTTSMGRLTLNILLSFAQFEREIISERIRDKVAASKRKGKHTGGIPVFGYDIDREKKRLIVSPEEAKIVRWIFRRFAQLEPPATILRDLDTRGIKTKRWTGPTGKTAGGGPWNRSHLYRLLNNPKYVGLVEHRGETYPGEHEAIVPQDLWDQVQAILTKHRTGRDGRKPSTPALLRGLLFCEACGRAMGQTYTKKNGRTYRYYLCVRAAKNGYAACPVRSVPAGQIEGATVDQLRAIFRSPEVIARTYRAAKKKEDETIERLTREREDAKARLSVLKRMAAGALDSQGDEDGRSGSSRSLGLHLHRTGEDIEEVETRLAVIAAELPLLESNGITEREVIHGLSTIDPLWDELFPAEQERIVQLLVERITLGKDGIEIAVRGNGLRCLAREVEGKGAGTNGSGPVDREGN